MSLAQEHPAIASYLLQLVEQTPVMSIIILTLIIKNGIVAFVQHHLWMSLSLASRRSIYNQPFGSPKW